MPYISSNILQKLKQQIEVYNPSGNMPGITRPLEERFHFDVAELDAMFTQKTMPLFCMHEIRSTVRQAGAATGFLLAIITLLAKQRTGPIIWIASRASLAETGTPYGPGLKQIGFDPDHLLLVKTPQECDALWAAEETLALGGISCIILHLQSSAKKLTLAASKRLHLRAKANKIPLFTLIIGSNPSSCPSLALTRWWVKAHQAGDINGFDEGIGHPAFCVTLDKNRQGHTGYFKLQWNSHDYKFESAQFKSTNDQQHKTKTNRETNARAALSGSVVSLSSNRSSRTA